MLISIEAGYLWQLLRDSIRAIDSKAQQQGCHMITFDMLKYMAQITDPWIPMCAGRKTVTYISCKKIQPAKI